MRANPHASDHAVSCFITPHAIVKEALNVSHCMKSQCVIHTDTNALYDIQFAEYKYVHVRYYYHIHAVISPAIHVVFPCIPSSQCCNVWFSTSLCSIIFSNFLRFAPFIPLHVRCVRTDGYTALVGTNCGTVLVCNLNEAKVRPCIMVMMTAGILPFCT